jgi:hypothetical protein
VQIIAMTASCWAPVRPGSAVLIPARHYAAVHVPDRASHPRGLVGQQEADRLGDVLRTAYPADWVEAVETLKRGVDQRRFDEALEDRVSTTAGETAFTRMRALASSMARCWVRECRPALAIEYAEEGVAATACLAHIDPMFTMLPPIFRATMFLATVCVTKNSDLLMLRYRS